MKLLYLLSFIFLFACSAEEQETQDESEPVMEYKIMITDNCDTAYNVTGEYCVTETVYDSVIAQFFLNSERGDCEKISFNDIQGNEITAYIEAGSKGYTKNPCN